MPLIAESNTGGLSLFSCVITSAKNPAQLLRWLLVVMLFNASDIMLRRCDSLMLVSIPYPNPDKPEPKRYKVGRSQNLRKPNNHEGSLRQAAKLSVLKHSIYLVRY